MDLKREIEWRPVVADQPETYPPNMKRVMLAGVKVVGPTGITLGWWDINMWFRDDGRPLTRTPSHWAELPSAP